MQKGIELTFKTRNEIKKHLDQMLQQDYKLLNEQQVDINECNIPKNNDFLMQYIKLIYEEYNIKDPLSNKNYIHKGIHLVDSRVSQHQGQSYQQITPKIKIKTKHFREQSIQNSSKNRQQQSTIYNSVTPSSHKNSFAFRLSENKQKKQIKQIFRYCIGCEKAILQSNIELHQVNCYKFGQFYEMSPIEIANALKKKIDLLRAKINATNKQLKDRHISQFKQSAQKILKESKVVIEHGLINTNFMHGYKNAMKIGNLWSKATEEINKIHWFSKIRQKIKQEFNC